MTAGRQGRQENAARFAVTSRLTSRLSGHARGIDRCVTDNNRTYRWPRHCLLRSINTAVHIAYPPDTQWTLPQQRYAQ